MVSVPALSDVQGVADSLTVCTALLLLGGTARPLPVLQNKKEGPLPFLPSVCLSLSVCGLTESLIVKQSCKEP